MTSPIPPGLAAMLGGSPDNQPPQDGGGQPVDMVKQVIDLVMQIIQAEPEPEDKATFSDVLLRLQKYLAKDQAEQDKAVGGTVSPRMIRKLGPGG